MYFVVVILREYLASAIKQIYI